MQLLPDIVLRPVAAGEASALAARFADCRYQQHPAYAVEAAARVGAQCEFFAADAAGEAIGFAAVRVKRLPILPGGLAYLHCGPAVQQAGAAFDPAIWSRTLAALAQHYHARGFLLRVSSPLLGAEDAALGERYREAGFMPAKRHAGRTICLDLAPDLDALRARLDGKWRTDLNRAERSALEVKRSSDPADIASLAPMLDALAADKGFHVNQDARFFAASAAAAAAAAPASQPPFLAHLAYRDGQLVAGHIGAFAGKRAVYLLGAANREGRETRAAYLLQWQVIEYAREIGCADYDLGGIDPAANPGVYRFKSRMGGVAIDNAAWWERPGNPLATIAVRLAERWRARQ